MGGMGEKITTIAVAIVGVAILALLVSKKADTKGVIGAAAGGFSQALGVALSPVTGGGGGGSNFGSYGFNTPF